jgi:hypothetical protein
MDKNTLKKDGFNFNVKHEKIVQSVISNELQQQTTTTKPFSPKQDQIF